MDFLDTVLKATKDYWFLISLVASVVLTSRTWLSFGRLDSTKLIHYIYADQLAILDMLLPTAAIESE